MISFENFTAEKKELDFEKEVSARNGDREMKIIMKSVNKIEKYKYEIISLLLLSLAALGMILYSYNGKWIFGSTKDWLCQHVAFVESFRNNYLLTGDFFPDFLAGVGAGQNIYNFSYYGLFRPDVIFACLFPGIEVKNILIGYMLLLYVLGTWCLYGWLRRNKRRISTSLFMCVLYLTSSILFQSHRQIMFVNYMPFLIMSLWGVEKCIEDKKELLLTVNVFLMILHSYYFSVTGIILCLIYFVYKEGGQRKRGVDWKERRMNWVRIIYSIGCGGMAAGILLVPTAVAMLQNGRTKESVDTSNLWQFDWSMKSLLLHPYGCGFAVIVLVLLCLGIFSRHYRKLTLTVLFCMGVPAVSYVLNGMLYVRSKVFLCFIPIILFLVSGVWEELQRWYMGEKQQIHKRVVVVICMIGTVVLQFQQCIYNNEEETYVPETQYEDVYEKADFEEQESGYRTCDLSAAMDGANLLTTPTMLKSSVYSSVDNSAYEDFWKNVMQNPQSIRNSLALTACENIFFQTFMGEKYIYNVDGTMRVENSVLPIAYVSCNLMSESEFEKVEYPYTMETIVNRTIVEPDQKNQALLDNTTEYQNQITEQNINFETLWKNIEELQDGEQDITEQLKLLYDTEGQKIQVDSKEDLTVHTTVPDSEGITILTFEVDKAAKQDILVTINGETEKLSAKTAPYPNNNTFFTYVLDGTPEELTIEFSAGSYTLQNFKCYTCGEDTVQQAVNQVTQVKECDTTGKQILNCEADTTEEGYFVTSIPYQSGMRAYVDGTEVTVEKVNEAFAGLYLEAGEHQIVLKFYAPGKTFGIICSLLGVVGTIMGLLIYNKDRKKRKKIEKREKM